MTEKQETLKLIDTNINEVEDYWAQFWAMNIEETYDYAATFEIESSEGSGSCNFTVADVRALHKWTGEWLRRREKIERE